MNKRKEIEEMASILGNGCDTPCHKCLYNENCSEFKYAQKLYENDYRRQRYSKWLFVCEHANRLDYECENCRNHIQTINETDYILAYKRCPNCGAIMEDYKKRIL